MPSRPRLPMIAYAASLFAVLALVASPARSQAISGTYNKTDAAFASMMLPHHEGGVKLGQLAADKGQNAQIRSLGAGIVATQTKEAKTLRAMVKAFKTKKVITPEIDKRDKLDMSKLEAASGTDFDMKWLDVISAHHSAAIQMAQFERRGGINHAARRLAAKIIAKQRKELRQFNALTEQLGG